MNTPPPIQGEPTKGYPSPARAFQAVLRQSVTGRVTAEQNEKFMRSGRLLFSALALIATIACGGSSAPPTAPTPVIPQLTGQYVGSFTVTSCNETGAAQASNFCRNLGNGGLHIFTPTQNGSALTGTLGLGQLSMPVTGNVGSDNVVSLAGSSPIDAATLTLTSWRGTLSGATLAGSMAFSIVTVTPVGAATVQATFSLAR